MTNHGILGQVTKPRIAALALVPAILALTACTADDGLDAAVADLEAALESHSLDGVEVTGAPGTPFADLVAPLEGYALDVTAGEAVREGDRAEVPLTFAWDLAGEEWSYEVPAALVSGDDGAWALEWSPELVAEGLTEGEALEVTREFPERAEIRGAGGETIVTDRPVTRYGLDKSWIEPDQVADSAARIAEATGVDPEEFADRAEQMGDLAFVEAVVLRPEDAEGRVAADFAEIPGANAVETTMLLAPTRAFARDLIGSVGEATAEVIEASEGALVAGDQAGLSGLQATHDAQLRGEPAVTVAAFDAADCDEDGSCAEADRRVVAETAGANGEPLETTLDVDLQTRADEILAETGGSAAIVAIEPSTGAIRAAASSLDASVPNLATAGQFPPGSTFKVVTSLALLRAGMSPDDTVACTDALAVDGFEFHNFPDYPAGAKGEISLRDAVANSCNTALIAERDRIDDGALAEAASSLGLGAEADLGFPAFLGDVPPAESETERAANMIGQGRVLASPLAMATVAASVAAGETVAPTLFEQTEAAPEVPLSADEAETLRSLMRSVVTDGSASFLDGIEPAVGAKTGTAEFGEPDEHGDLATHAWMIATKGDLAVAAFVENGGSGSDAAGSIIASLLG